MRGDLDQAVTTGGAEGRLRDSALLEAIEGGARGHGRHPRPIARDLGGEQIGVFAGRQADDLQAIGVCVDDRQRALADRTGGSEDGDAFHKSSFQLTAVSYQFSYQFSYQLSAVSFQLRAERYTYFTKQLSALS